jgi:sphingomyelin phosphodiesterase
MKFTNVVNALGVAVALPALSSAFTVSELMGKSLNAYATSKRDVAERDLAERDLVSTILTDIENLAECTACEALLVVLKVLAHLGNDDFVSVITTVCEDLVRCFLNSSARLVAI